MIIHSDGIEITDREKWRQSWLYLEVSIIVIKMNLAGLEIRDYILDGSFKSSLKHCIEPYRKLIGYGFLE
jgi:hypothetical protein